MVKAEFSGLAEPGARIAVRVTPGASRNMIEMQDGVLRVHVTAIPEGGKANAAVLKLLSRALGVPKSRLELQRGATARDKLFRVLG